MKLRFTAVFLCLFFSLTINLFAQPGGFQGKPFNGKVVDAQSNESLPGANVLMVFQRDTTRKIGVITDSDGLFSFPRVREGMTVNLRISFVGYQTFSEMIELKDLETTQVFKISPAIEQLEEIKDKVDAAKLEPVTAAVEELKKAHAAQDVPQIDAATESVNNALQAIQEDVQAAYAQDQQAGGAAPEAGDQADANEEVTDVDFEEVK